MKTPPPTVQSLHVIYDADGTLTGELVYLAKKLLGLAHCAACDITHGPRKEKPEFTQLKQASPVPVHNIHRDELDDAMHAAVDGVLPCVVARTTAADVRIMDPRDLDLCRGDVVRFAHRVRECVGQAGLDMPEKVAPVCERVFQTDGTVPGDARLGGLEDRLSESSSAGDMEAVVPTGVY